MNSFDSIPQFSKVLANLDQWMVKAEAFAKAKSFDVNVFVEARLAPDQYGFARQVQAACDSAKFAAAYMAGKTPPAHPDTEKTMAELRARVQTCRAYLETITQADCAGCDERKVMPQWLGGKWVRGDHYLLQVAIPNFYFHATTAYAILRHNGVDVGKMDFLGTFPIQG
jgi:hypothetical protein